MNLSNPAEPSLRLAALFPPGVCVAELTGPGVVGLLFPAEAACLGRMVASRAAEFAAGRLCARRAIASLGIADFAVLAAVDRKPVWPEGVVGSITHTDGICAAVVAPRSDFLGLGLDLEAAGRVTAPLAERICVPAELAWLESLPAATRPAGRALVFAAKEAFYKAQSPLTDEWLGFEALTVEVSGLAAAMAQGVVGEFRATPTRAIALDRWVAGPFSGRFRLDERYVAAALALNTPVRRGIP